MEPIKIYEGRLVDARELHQFLESKQDFSDWIKNRIKRYSFEEGLDFSINLWKSPIGRPSKEYTLSLDMAKELAMVENNAKGREPRRYFIEAEEKLRELAKNKRLAAFMKLESTKDKFKDTLLSKGLSKENYIEIDTEGKKVFMNGEVVDDGLLQTVLLTARDLATQMTHHNTVEHDLDKTEDIKSENRKNHSSIRDTLIENDIVPERNPKQEDVKKLKK